MTKEKKGSMTPLKDILHGLLSGANLNFNPADAEIWEVWDDVVGRAIAEHAQPSNIIKKKLRVNVVEPIWLQELDFVAETIRERLNSRLGRNAVEKIIFLPYHFRIKTGESFCLIYACTDIFQERLNFNISCHYLFTRELITTVINRRPGDWPSDFGHPLSFVNNRKTHVLQSRLIKLLADGFYPRATSRIIITENPAIVAIVTRSMFSYLL